MKPIGVITRGTTNPNRLRRIDLWMAWRYETLLQNEVSPLVVDLGYGATPVTTHEFASRLAQVNSRVEVIGLEIDPERVATASLTANAQVWFRFGGFELPTPRPPLIVKAFNVLRQYPESEVINAWKQMQARLAPGGRIVEGTCDELGRKAVWVELDEHQPLTLTFAAHLRHLETPSDLAPRLPKALIHRNIPGEPIHALLHAMDRAWAAKAGLSVFSSRQRWAAMVNSLRENFPIVTPPSRAKHGELTIDWSAVSNADVERR